MALVKAVLFDYGMVLSGEPDSAAWARLMTITGLSEVLLHREYWAHRHAYDRGDLNSTSFWHTVATGAGIIITPTQLAQLIAADTDLWSTLNPPMLAWVDQLQRAGIRTGILSNMPDAMEDWPSRPPLMDRILRPPHLVPRHQSRQARTRDLSSTPPRASRHPSRKHPLPRRQGSENIAAALAAGMQAIQYSSSLRLRAARCTPAASTTSYNLSGIQASQKREAIVRR